MGPEPYSIAITPAKNMSNLAFRNNHIDATHVDENENFGKTIETEVYPVEQLKSVPPEIFFKYFIPVEKEGHFRVIDTLRQSVHYKQHNLLSLKPLAIGYRLIICKNVLLHFSLDERIKVINMFHSALAPGGYFATEQTQELPEELAHLFVRVSNEGPLYLKAGST